MITAGLISRTSLRGMITKDPGPRFPWVLAGWFHRLKSGGITTSTERCPGRMTWGPERVRKNLGRPCHCYGLWPAPDAGHASPDVSVQRALIAGVAVRWAATTRSDCPPDR